MFQLPAFTQGLSIKLISYAEGTLSDNALFVPRVAIYDADFKPTRYFDEKTLRNRGNNLERTIFFNPKDAHERWLVVFGSDLSSSIERSYPLVTVTPVVAGPVVFSLVNGSEGKSTLRSSPVGWFNLEVQGPQVAKPR